MSREDAQFKLRLSDDLRNQVANAARRNNRSMNAEITARLESSFQSEEFTTLPPGISASKEELEELINKVAEGLFGHPDAPPIKKRKAG